MVPLGVELYNPGTRTRNSPRVAALRSCGFLPAVHQLFEPSRGVLFSEAVNSIFVFALIFHGLLICVSAFVFLLACSRRLFGQISE